MAAARQRWGTKFGVILAVSGSAMGLGNFLRFPGKVVLNGGGAFMIPYFIAFLLLGIPVLWVEWTTGRYGGSLGHGSAVGVFDRMAPGNKYAKYFGAIGVVIPFVMVTYYMYIEAWALGYSFFSFSNYLYRAESAEAMKSFLYGFLGQEKNEFFQSISLAYLFFLITFAVNFYFIYKGIRSGIEKLVRIAVPLLILIGILLMIRVLTMESIDPMKPGLTVINGLGFFWNPDFSKLKDAQIWLEASGQIFFTMSVGIGAIITYASYMKRNDDVALTGLTAGALNEFCEVILAGSIVVPATFVFLGATGAIDVASSGIFHVGFVTLPMVLGQLPMGFIFSGLWFLLLFVAAITSSVSLIQPAIAFFEDEFGWSRNRTVLILAATAFVICQPIIFFQQHGIIDELDFWSGTFFLVLFATCEVILFGWIFGIDRGWKELHVGAKINVPVVFKFIIKYVTPLYLLSILCAWFIQKLWPTLLLQNIAKADFAYLMGARIIIVLLFLIFFALVTYAWKNRKKEKK